MKNRITLAISALVVVIITSISYYTLAYFEEKTKESIAVQQFAMVSAVAEEIDDKLSHAHNLIIGSSKAVTPDKVYDHAKAQSLLDSMTGIHTVFDNGLYLFDSKGILIAESPFRANRQGKDFSFREYMQVTLSTRTPYIGNPYFSTQKHGHPAVIFTAPVFDKRGEIIAVLAGSIDLTRENFLGRLTNIRIGKTGYLYLYGKDRTMIVHPDISRLLKQDVPVGSNLIYDRAIDGFEGTEETVTSRGLHAITSVKHLRMKDWILGANYPVAEAYSAIDQARKSLVIIIAFVIVVVLGIVRFLVSRLTAPLLLLTDHVERITKGMTEERHIRIESSDEVGKLCSAFNGMITEIDRRKDDLESEKERLVVTLRSIGDGVIATDTDGRILMMNRVAEQLTGWTQEEAAVTTFREVFRITDVGTRRPCESPFDRVLATGGIVTISGRIMLLSKNGEEIMIADSGAPIRDRESRIIGVVIVFRNITEKIKMEEEMSRTEKLESLGILAGGIAHDFNNLLTAILGNISLAKIFLSPDDKAFERIEKAEAASERARDLTHQLLTFAKGGEPVRKTASIAEIVREAADFVLRGTNVRCEYAMSSNLRLADIDKGQISRVIHNLVINAAQAMPEGGVISVAASNIDIRSGDEHALTPGPYIMISVRDHGPGIAGEHLHRIFDPYFTTKPGGSGLGLATSYSIVRGHNGHIGVESRAGFGTLFSIYLPASADTSESDRGLRVNLHTGRGKILVMDDDEAVHDVLTDMLVYLGYEPFFSRDGQAMLDAYINALKSGCPFNAVILDLTIPGGMGGKDAMRRLLEIDPLARAIVSSGYSTDPVMANFREFGFLGVVAKPYRVDEVSEQLHKIIG